MKEIKNKALQFAIEQTLSEHPIDPEETLNLLNEWCDTGEQPEEILVWEPYECWEAEFIYEHIDNTMWSVLNLIKDINVNKS